MACGPQVSACALASQYVSESGHILLINTTAAVAVIREGIDWTYTTTGSQEHFAKSSAPYYIQILKPQTICMLTENEAYNISGRDMYKEEYEAAGIDILSDEIFEPGTTDFYTIIARLREKDPDLLSIGPRPASGILIVKQIYETGWNVQITSHGDLMSEDMFRVVGPATEGIIAFTTVKNYWAFKDEMIPQAALDAMGIDLDWYYAVADSYVETYGTGQERWAVEYYAIVNAFINAMQKAGSINDAVKIREALTGMEYEDPNGFQQVLPTQRFKNWYGVGLFHESATGMDNYEILAVSTNTDDWQEVWEVEIVKEWPSFPELREIRGY